MTLSLNLSIKGAKEALDMQRAMRKRLSKTGVAMDRAAVMMLKDVLEHFRDQAGPSGAWKPLSPITIKRRREGGGGAKILMDKGLLRNSIQPSAGEDFARVGTNVFYAPQHQFGTGRVPQREFLWLSDVAKDKITRMIGEFVVEGK